MIDPKPGDEDKRVVYAFGRPNEESGTIVTWDADHVHVQFDRFTTIKINKPLRCTRASLQFEEGKVER